MMIGSTDIASVQVDMEKSHFDETCCSALPVMSNYVPTLLPDVLRKRPRTYDLKENVQPLASASDGKRLPLPRIPHELFDFGIDREATNLEDKRTAVLEILSELAEDLHDFSLSHQSSSSQSIDNIHVNGLLSNNETSAIHSDLLSSQDDISVDSCNADLIDPVDPDEVFGDDSVSSVFSTDDDVFSLNSDDANADLAARPNKRQRLDDDNSQAAAESNDDKAMLRFKSYQKDQWFDKYNELCEYREVFGHTQVHYDYKENVALARWAKRQRYQYKLLKQGKPSTMTAERISALEKLGFIWDSQTAQWEERLHELKEFRKVHGHCEVPSRYLENRKLAIWVKIQRRQHKLLLAGRSSNITWERIAKLDELDFAWEIIRR